MVTEQRSREMREKDHKKENQELDDKKEKKSKDIKIKDTTETSKAAKKDKNSKKGKGKISPVKLLTILSILLVLVIVFIVGMYFSYVRNSKAIAEKVASAYTSGDVQEFLDLIPPGHKDYFRENYSFSDLESTYKNYLDEFAQKLEPDVGKISDIEATYGSIVTVSNIDDIRKEMSKYGIDNLNTYRMIEAEWTVTGDKGSKVISVEIYVMKVNEQWYLDHLDY